MLTFRSLAASLSYYVLVPAGSIGLTTVVLIGVLMMAIAEVLEFMLAGRYAKKYGGSKRAGCPRSSAV